MVYANYFFKFVGSGTVRKIFSPLVMRELGCFAHCSTSHLLSVIKYFANIQSFLSEIQKIRLIPILSQLQEG